MKNPIWPPVAGVTPGLAFKGLNKSMFIKSTFCIPLLPLFKLTRIGLIIILEVNVMYIDNIRHQK